MLKLAVEKRTEVKHAKPAQLETLFYPMGLSSLLRNIQHVHICAKQIQLSFPKFFTSSDTSIDNYALI